MRMVSIRLTLCYYQASQAFDRVLKIERERDMRAHGNLCYNIASRARSVVRFAVHERSARARGYAVATNSKLQDVTFA